MKSYWTEIMQANFNLLALFLLVNIKEQSVSAEFRVIPDAFGPVVIPSESHPLSSTAILRCVLTISPDVNYEARWIGPGEVGMIDPSTSNRYTITNATFVLQNGPPHWTRTKLTIHELSYQDAGVYTCTGRTQVELNELASPSWMSATLNLQLDVDLLSKFNETVVMATIADSTVELSCEMRAFIRPDSSLVWQGPNNQRLIGGIGKYQITFSNGSSDTAVNGTLVPSRVSTLTILNPDKSDGGVYTCSVMGTNKTIDLLIMINDKKAQGGVTTTQKVGCNAAKSWYCYVNTLATFVVMSIGVLIQFRI